jgi:hypothetical protein
MWKRLYLKPFEAFVGLFVIVNGLLTISPIGTGSSVKDNLWNLLGYTGIVVPIFQIVAGIAKIIGLAFSKSNLECSGLIMVTTIFFIRAISLSMDAQITSADINSLTICVGIIVSNTIRILQITNSHKYVITEVQLQK